MIGRFFIDSVWAIKSQEEMPLAIIESGSKPFCHYLVKN